MNITDMSKPVTAAALNESLEKRFGKRVKLESFSLEQLQNSRNKLRTKLYQIETNESYGAVNNSEAYQKNKLFLDVLNAEIQERSHVSENKSQSRKKMTKKTGPVAESRAQDRSPLDKATDQLSEAMQGKLSEDAQQKILRAMSNIDTARDSMPRQTVVREGAEDQAEIVMAAKNMVDKITGWMEDTAEMQTESMLDLNDSIRDELGEVEADKFTQKVKPSLISLYSALESTRAELVQGVQMVAGEDAPDMPGDGNDGSALGGDDDDMGTDDDLEPTVDQDDEEPDLDLDDEEDDDGFGAGPAAAGGGEEAGREKRESVSRRGQRLTSMLGSKKK